MKTYIRKHIGDLPLTGSDVEAILTRAKERAVLTKRDENVQLADIEEAVSSFIDPLDPELLQLQELAAVLECTQMSFLPAEWRKKISQPDARSELQQRMVAIRQLLEE